MLTHVDYRGRGFATAVTGAVTAELLRTCDQVVLNVRSDNPPALAAYRRLGYASTCRFEERLVHRLGSPWPDLAAPLRRLFARKESDPMTASTTLPAHDVADLGLAAEGVRRIEWAEREMPVLRLIRERFERERPLDGLRIGACLHVTTETANLMRTLKAGGAEVVLSASNPLSTKDDVAAALVAEYGISVYARRGEDRDTYYAHLERGRRHASAADDGRRLRPRLAAPQRAAGPGDGGPRRDRGDDHRRHPPQGDGRRRGARLPVDGRQRGADQAPLRQPLRHRPVHGGRHPARHEHPARRPQRRRRRLRLGGQGHRLADGRHGRPRRGRRGGPGPRPRGAHGRLRRS